MRRDRQEVGLPFALAAGLFVLGIVAVLIAGFTGDLADAVDDVPIWLLAAAGAIGLICWRKDLQENARLEDRDAEAGERESELEKRIREREQEVDRERSLRARTERARRAEHEWARELRTQLVQLHRREGALGHTGDVRELVLKVALELVEGDRGLLLSREDGDGDGDLDLVCHLGFDNDPTHSAVAQEFAGRVLDRDETVREDNAARLDGEGHNAADEEIDNLLAIPVYIADDFSGVVVCANRDGGFEDLDDEVLLALGDHAGAVLENGRLHGDLRRSYMSTVRMLTEAIEVKDPSVRIHSDEVAGYVAAVATKLEIDPRRREELVIASLLHDVGKIGISERILLKPGPLTQEERTAVELHPRIGFRLVEQVPALGNIAPAVLHHHERFDGAGYPAGLSGEQIPLEARVICVADCFSAMTSERPYGSPMSLEDAYAELERCAGTQFDPKVVRLFVDEVRKNPPSTFEPDGLAIALDDPEIDAQRAPGEPVLGHGPVGMVDNLTMLYSHRHLHDTAAAQAEQASVQSRPFAAVVVRLDGLGETNERDGYAAGDDTLQAVARAAQREASRAGGTACRMSGRRIAVVVPGASEDTGWELARAVSAQVADRECETSVGAAAWQPGDSGAAVLARAEAALGAGAAPPSTTPV